MIVLPSYIEGILFGRRENRAKWNASWHGEMKVKNSEKRWSSHLKCQHLGPCTGLGATGPCQGRSKQSPGMGRDPVGSLGSRASPTWEQKVPSNLAPGCPHCISSHTLTMKNSQLRGEKVINLVFGVCLFLLAKGERGEQLLHAPLTPEVWLHLRAVTWRKVTGTCRQEPLTYIKKVYSRESVYISINILCIYINKYIKRKECIILMQHKAVLRERVSKYKHCDLGYTDLGKRKDVFDCFISSQFCFKNCTLTCIFVKLFIDINISVHWFK